MVESHLGWAKRTGQTTLNPVPETVPLASVEPDPCPLLCLLPSCPLLGAPRQASPVPPSPTRSSSTIPATQRSQLVCDLKLNLSKIFPPTPQIQMTMQLMTSLFQSPRFGTLEYLVHPALPKLPTSHSMGTRCNL